MVLDGRSWLLRYHPYSYRLLALAFALPAVAGLALVWPDVAGLPAAFPQPWGAAVLLSTLVAAGMVLRSVTPPAALVDPDHEVFSDGD